MEIDSSEEDMKQGEKELHGSEEYSKGPTVSEGFSPQSKFR